MELTHEDLIGSHIIEVDGVGCVKVPTLQDIWDIKYKMYELMYQYLYVDFPKYLELRNLTEKYNALSDENKKLNTFYYLMLSDQEFVNMYMIIFSFFVCGTIKFDDDSLSFVVNETKFDEISKQEKEIIVGKIDNSNFEEVRNILLQVNHLKSTKQDTEPIKYKNELARKLAERMEKASQKKASQNNTLSFGRMISKYCADNKNGINMLNVHQLTIYQFYDQWIEHNNIRQCDLQDRIYANTVNLSDVNNYDLQLWLKENK